MEAIVPKIEPTIKQDLAWQKLSVNEESVKYLTFGGGAGGGKAQPLNAKVLTKNGFKRMGDIKVGDYLITPENGEKRVIAVHPQGIQDIYEIEFEDGAKTKATKEHLWSCWATRRGKSRKRIKQTQELLKEFPKKYSIPLPEKILFGKKYSNISPYLIGVLLGDGGLTKNNIVITTADKEIINNIKDELGLRYRINKKKDFGHTITANIRNDKGYPINPLIETLRSLGLMGKKSEDKFIPLVFKNSDYETRLGLLQGLMDTDGTVYKNGRCCFNSKSYQLAKDVQYLVRSIGGKARINKRIKKFDYKNGDKVGTFYDVAINHINKRLLFRLNRKKRRCGQSRFKGRTIKKITFIGREKCKCITIDDKNGLYFTDDFIITHNSWLGCEWLTVMCYMFPGSKWFVGRNELSRLMKSVYVTFKKVWKHHNIPIDDWIYNGQYNYLENKITGSRIDFLDVVKKPADPLYERFGSLEYTGGWLEEAGEIDFMAFDVLKSRIGRCNSFNIDGEDFIIPSKILITCNPKKNWLYQMVYKPSKEGRLPKEYAFIQSLYGDNPYTAEKYGEELSQIKDDATRQRLQFGNWEYDDELGNLIEYDAIVDLFTNTLREDLDPYPERYLSADIARFGKDKTVIGLWHGFRLKKPVIIDRSTLDQVETKIRDLLTKNRIPRSYAIVDEDGLGGGIVDNLKVKGFVANSTPLKIPARSQRENFKTLKDQCGFMLAEKINNREMAISIEGDEKLRQTIIEELEQLKQKDPEKEGKLQLVPKEEMKEKIGRSPDILDMMLMRMYHELKRPEKLNSVRQFKPDYKKSNYK
ncbi:hypothetical protein GF386_01925 [Candidatus Pacearchaeota archaeon]|nr:hypothetical protein [Candidatus Pacearchaeota archaeon]